MPKSLVWSYMSELEGDASKAVCSICSTVIIRGKTTKSYSTKPLSNHLSTHEVYVEAAKKHAAEEAAAAAAAATSSGSSATGTPGARKEKARTQTRIDNPFFKGTVKWKLSDARSLKQHKKLLRMVAVDNHPFTLVEDQGFIEYTAGLQPNYPSPCKKYVQGLLHQEYDEARATVAAKLERAVCVSFTSDIWSDTTSNVTFISLSGISFPYLLTRVTQAMGSQSYRQGEQQYALESPWDYYFFCIFGWGLYQGGRQFALDLSGNVKEQAATSTTCPKPQCMCQSSVIQAKNSLIILHSIIRDSPNSTL